MITIKEAKQFIGDHANEGVNCPCCGQLCVIYKRRLHAEMAIFLIKLVKEFRRTRIWVHVNTISKKKCSDGMYLIQWGLIVRKPKLKGDEKTSGLYKPTDEGIDFAMNQTVVPSFAWLFDKRVIEFSSETVNIVKALGTKFDYQDLMNT